MGGVCVIIYQVKFYYDEVLEREKSELWWQWTEMNLPEDCESTEGCISNGNSR